MEFGPHKVVGKDILKEVDITRILKRCVYVSVSLRVFGFLQSVYFLLGSRDVSGEGRND